MLRVLCPEVVVSAAHSSRGACLRSQEVVGGKASRPKGPEGAFQTWKWTWKNFF